MHVPINVKSSNNISEWQMGFNSAFKGLITLENESFIAPTNVQNIYIKTIKFLTLKYITIVPACFGFD